MKMYKTAFYLGPLLLENTKIWCSKLDDLGSVYLYIFCFFLRQASDGSFGRPPEIQVWAEPSRASHRHLLQRQADRPQRTDLPDVDRLLQTLQSNIRQAAAAAEVRWELRSQNLFDRFFFFFFFFWFNLTRCSEITNFTFKMIREQRWVYSNCTQVKVLLEIFTKVKVIIWIVTWVRVKKILDKLLK